MNQLSSAARGSASQRTTAGAAIGSLPHLRSTPWRVDVQAAAH
jgi:hypothetical protein